eukprot:7383416-Prymnesium_polylepis.3
MKGLHNRRGDRRRPRAYGIPRMDILDERLREAAPPSLRSPQKTRPGEAGEPKNVAGGASPGPPRPMDGPDALRAVHAIYVIPGAGKGLKAYARDDHEP